MNSLLLTGFEPFTPFDTNPSGEVAVLLDGEKVNSCRITGKVLPVSFREAAARILQLIDELQPDAILCLGLAAGRSKVSIERFAVNYYEGTDNSGLLIEGSVITQDGPVAFFAAAPVRSMADHITRNGLPAEVSNTAGVYVCNYVFYRVLHSLEQRGNQDLPVAFLHIPADHRIAIKHANCPGWSPGDLAKAVRLAVEALGPAVDSIPPIR